MVFSIFQVNAFQIFNKMDSSHNSGITIDIYGYNMRHMTKRVQVFKYLCYHSPHYNKNTKFSYLSTWKIISKKLSFHRTKMPSQCERKSKTYRKKIHYQMYLDLDVYMANYNHMEGDFSTPI